MRGSGSIFAAVVTLQLQRERAELSLSRAWVANFFGSYLHRCGAVRLLT
ncbi:MAG: hypothetical protein HOK53_09820 [Gammaproteobacteria bacterium]|nr:hypothetical protein [Pseudomonadales bacterium]MBT6482179.1 hypothetical protein [Gammaproteobacteria bacterium]